MRIPSTQPTIIAPEPGGPRRWLRSDMLVLRWVLLGLYLVIVGGLLGWVLFEPSDTFFIAIVLALLASQALMIFGTGTIHLCRPLRRRRLVLPILGASFMLTLLVGGFLLAMIELLYLESYVDLPLGWMYLAAIAGSWIGWGVLLWNHVRYRPRYATLSRLTTLLFTGSLAELLATVPAHVLVSRRPGCFVGIGTMFGILAGLSVMLASFGPAIVLLFLRPRHRAEVGADGHPHCPACGYDLRATRERCPECGLTISA